MDSRMEKLLMASEELELNMSRLYALFREQFPKHAKFWWNLSLEEVNHASVVKSGREYFAPIGKFPEALVCTSLERVEKANAEILALTNRLRNQPPAEKETFNLALNLERRAGEMQMQVFMIKKTEDKVEQAFQKISGDCKEHFRRLVQYMKDHAIPVEVDGPPEV